MVAVLLWLAGCQTSEAPAPPGADVVSVAFSARLAGELEPCG